MHGYGTCKADLLDLALALHASSPFHLLLIDFRAHGTSGGRSISFGKSEVWDIEAALRFFEEEPQAQGLPIGCLGISMGGAIGILAARRFPRIRALVSDSAYADLGMSIARAQWLLYHIPRIPLGQMVIWGTQWRLKCRVSELSPALAIGAIAPRPIFLIHGEKDQTVPAGQAKVLADRARPPKTLWLVPGAEHVGCFYKDQQGYLKRVNTFFSDAFFGTA